MILWFFNLCLWVLIGWWVEWFTSASSLRISGLCGSWASRSRSPSTIKNCYTKLKTSRIEYLSHTESFCKSTASHFWTFHTLSLLTPMPFWKDQIFSWHEDARTTCWRRFAALDALDMGYISWRCPTTNAMSGSQWNCVELKSPWYRFSSQPPPSGTCHHHNHHHLSLSSLQPPPSVTYHHCIVL